jgi:hypothetical protein
MELKDFSWATAVLIFVTYVAIDMLYAFYIMCVEERRAVSAAATTSLIYSLLAYGVVSYSQNILYLIPLASGAFFGTLIMVTIKKRKEKS